jgi:type IV pilus assembly protein PilB
MAAAELPTSAPTPATSFGPQTPLGELLVRAGELAPEQLEQALTEQRGLEEHVRIGEILVSHNWITRKALAHALAEQHSLEFVDLARVEVDPAATSLLTEQFARRAQVLPVRFLGEDLLQVAVADPTNLATADDLRLALGVNIRLAVADAGALEGTIERTYRVHIEVTQDGETGPAPSLDDVLERDGEAPTIDLVNSILSRAIGEGASDVHFDPQPHETIVRARIDGVLRRMAEIPKAMDGSVMGRLKVMGALDIAEKRLPQDGSFSIRHGEHPVDVRVAVVPTKHGEHIVLRLLQRAARLELPELGLSAENEGAFLASVHQPYGAVITCGPTGSGKTTTLYAALGLLNEEGRAITTIEDPVEYQLPGVNQVEAHTKIGLNFARGLRTILRSDPDVLLIGEIRDEETAAIAVQSALTGHLVFTTVHANNVVDVLGRFLNMKVDLYNFVSALNCVLAQRLVRRICQECKHEVTYSDSFIVESGLDPRDFRNKKFFEGEGCLECNGTGFHGRAAISELLDLSDRIRGMILDRRPASEIKKASKEEGMMFLRESALRKVMEGQTTLREINKVTFVE